MKRYLLTIVVLWATQLAVWAQPDLAGKWDGGDWGAVEIWGDAASYQGSYTATFNQQQGSLTFSIVGRYDGVFKGAFRESGATAGHPLRQGNISLILSSDGNTAAVEWESTDSDTLRSPSGKSTWRRK